MASPSPSLPPPPSTGDDSSAQQQTPTSPASASPAPATPSPAVEQGTKMMLDVVQGLRAIAKTYPGASAAVAKINEIIRGEVMPAVMQHAEPAEPAAPPVGA
jgi:hypothetical protein